MTSLRFRRFFLPLLLWLSVIFYLSTRAGSDERTTSLLEAFFRLFPAAMQHLSMEQITGIDFTIRKTAHFTEYFIVSVLFVRWYRSCRLRVRDRALLFAWLSATLYAASDEFHQIFVPGRTPKVTDVCIDSTGALAAVLICAFLLRRRNRSKRNRVLIGTATEVA